MKRWLAFGQWRSAPTDRVVGMGARHGPDLDRDSRQRRRDRALVRAFGATAGLQAATVAGALISLPFVTRALSAAEYGVLATVTGFAVLLGFADFGVGSALTHRLAQGEGRNEETPVQSVVSSAIAVVTGAAAILVVLGLWATYTLPWQRLLGAKAIPETTLRWSVFVLVLSTALTIIGSLGKSALYGIQRGSTANHWLAASTLAGAASAILASFVAAPLWVFVIATVGMPAMVSLGCTWWTLRYTQLRSSPSIRAISSAELARLTGSGGWFFAIALAGALGYQTDSVVVAAILGAPAAGVYNVSLRVLGLVTQSVYPALMQLWPAFTEALGRGDIHWVRSRFWWSSVLAAAGAAVASAVLVLVGPTLIELWLTKDLSPPRELLFAFAVWTTYTLGLAPLFFLLNAVGKIRQHAYMAIATSIANIPSSIILTDVVGITGPVYASLLSSVIFGALPAAVLVRPFLARAST